MYFPEREHFFNKKKNLCKQVEYAFIGKNARFFKMLAGFHKETFYVFISAQMF